MSDDDVWAELVAELALRIPRLTDADTIILSRGPAYVQLQQGPELLSAEAVSNHHLPPDQQLPPEAEQRLVALGWQRPVPSLQPNWWYDVRWPVSHRDALRLARMLVDTLRNIYHVPGPDQLSQEVFNAISSVGSVPDPLTSVPDGAGRLG